MNFSPLYQMSLYVSVSLYCLQIPNIRRALKLTNGDLKLFASPWSAPAWMKTNGAMVGGGTLRGPPGGPYYTTWANYYVK